MGRRQLLPIYILNLKAGELMSSPSKLNLGTKFGAQDLISTLSQLDSRLPEPAVIQLCGAASVLLQCADFRKTTVIDFCSRPADTVISLVQSTWGGKQLFDFNAIGVIGLLIDYEDRLVVVDLGLQKLTVQCISTRDWVVSKLASPKLEDVLNHPCVTLEDLLWVQENMVFYGGVSVDRANNDLSYLIREFRERGDYHGAL